MITYLFASGIVSIDFAGGAEKDDEWKDASELDLEDEEEEVEVVVVEEVA